MKTGKHLSRIADANRQGIRVCVKCRVYDSEPIDDFIVMKNRLLIPLLLAASVVGCRTPHLAASFTGADGEVRLITEESEGYVLKFKSIEILQSIKNYFG